MISVTSLGDVNLDLITSKLRDFPERDGQKVISDLEISTGGCAANFAKAVSRLGLKTRLIGKLGSDSWGAFARNELKKAGVNLKVSRGKKTGITFVLNFFDGTRSFVTYPGANGELTLRDIKFKEIQGGYLHIGSFFLQGLRENTLKLLKQAHSKHMITSFDTGWDPEGWKKKDVNLVRKTLSEVDIFFPDLSEGKAITQLRNPQEICEKLLSLGPEIVALKLGGKGSFIATRERRFSISPFKVEVVDTTGAGDVFDAAFVYGHSKGWSLEKIGKFANLAAALSTKEYGSNGYPTLREVKKLLRK